MTLTQCGLRKGDAEPITGVHRGWQPAVPCVGALPAPGAEDIGSQLPGTHLGTTLSPIGMLC